MSSFVDCSFFSSFEDKTSYNNEEPDLRNTKHIEEKTKQATQQLFKKCKNDHVFIFPGHEELAKKITKENSKS